jgi:hypothetical protein
MDDRAEIAGSQGITYADLMRGSSLSTYSDAGYTLTGLEKPSCGGLRERYFGKGEAQVRAPPLPSPQPARVMIAAQAGGLGVTSLLFR